MKYIFSFLLLTFCSIIFSQELLSNITKIDLNIIENSFKKGNLKEYEVLSKKFPIYTINGKEYLSVLAKVNERFDASKTKKSGIIVGSQIQSFVSIKVPLDKISDLYSIEGIEYFEIATKIQASMDRANQDTRVDSVHAGINLPEVYSGKDVYIGITDWGFDYTNPNFYDTNLTQTRIVAAWDQYKQSGPAPNGFDYGTEYSTINELLNAQSDTSNIYNYAYHGSHVAGICGGSGAGTAFRGVAFEANFLFATFLIDAASVLDAYEWMYQKALADGKRLVINQSWGLHHMGNLDGTSILSQAIDAYSDLGVVFVSSGGNNGDVNFHLKKTFNNDALRSKVDFYSYAANPNMWGQSLTLWGEPTKNFEVGFQVLNSSNVILTETPYYATNLLTEYLDSYLIIGLDTVFFNLSCENANPFNQRPHARLRIKNTNSSYRIVMKVQALDGTVHCWNVTELITDVGNWGMPFSQAGTGTTAGNNQYGISEPACTKSTIAVAAHNSQYTNVSGTLVGGSAASFSSYGPTLDERIKPDVSAPGVSIGSSVSSFTSASFSSVATVNFNDRNYYFTKISGTSMAGPMVTGVVALIFDANPYLSSSQVKQIIKSTARTDNHTGVIPEEGSVKWGSGKLNAYAAIKMALEILGTEEISTNDFSIYPNPATSGLSINFDGNKVIEKIEIYDISGKLIQENLNTNTINIEKLNFGTYILRFESNGKIYQQKFTKF
jgi:minor extracellular serine protease Vpr